MTTYLAQHDQAKESRQIVSMLNDGKSVNEIAESLGLSRNEFLEQQIAKFAMHAIHYKGE